MNQQLILIFQFTLNLVICGIILKQWGLPKLRKLPFEEALAVLTAMHLSRTLGLFAVIPSVSGDYASATSWAQHVAIGDLAATILAIVAVFLLMKKHPLAIPATWIFNIVGFGDFLYASVNSFLHDILGHGLHAYSYVVQFGVPILLVSHVAIFYALLKKRAPAVRTPRRR